MVVEGSVGWSFEVLEVVSRVLKGVVRRRLEIEGSEWRVKKFEVGSGDEIVNCWLRVS